MTHFMEEKLRVLDEYINRLDTAISNNDSAMAHDLQKEIIAVYGSEIEGLKSNLDNYSISNFYSNTPADYLGDAKLLKAKLLNYKLNLASGLYKPFQGSDGAINLTQNVSQDVSATIAVTFEQAIYNIQELPESELTDEEKEILSGKLVSISTEQDKQKRWEKVGSALKWIAEKGIEVGKVALPYIVQSLGAGS